MSNVQKKVALVTGANQGVGFQVAKALVAHGFTVLVGARNWEKGKAAAEAIGTGAQAIQLDVTDRASIADAAQRIDTEFGRLDVLVQNAGIFSTRMPSLGLSLGEYAPLSPASKASLDEVRQVWETNVFGVLAVYQALLPLLRKAPTANIVNVSSAMGSLSLNAITLSMMVELEDSPIKVRLASPGFSRTALTGYAGYESVEEGAREVIRVALLGPEDPSGTFTQWENTTIPW